MNNSVSVLFPYVNKNNQLVFDDERFGLSEEAFVFGSDDLLIELAEKNGIKDLKAGFKLIYSKTFIPTYDCVVQLMGNDGHDGHFYAPLDDQARQIWLCPALLHYFHEAPENIYFKITER